MATKRVGFFFELSTAQQRDRVRELSREQPHPNEHEIVRYLSGGVDAGASMMIEHDFLEEPPRVLGEVILRSDGEWIWPSSLAYYVRQYHVELPNEFVELMKENNWQVPSDAEYTPEVPDGHIEM